MGSVPDEYVPFTVNRPLAIDKKPDDPSLLATLGAAGTIANWPYRSWRYLENRDGVDADPAHDPFALIRGTRYEADPERFAFSRNEQETRAIMAEWDTDAEAMDVLARSGKTGTVAAVGMGMLDPTIFLPILPVFSGIRAGTSALRIGADVALTAGATAAVGEAAMMATTPGYDGADAAFGIGSATVLGGLLGAGAGALLSGAERKSLIAKMDIERKEWAADTAPPLSSKPLAGTPNAVGAAAADTRQLDMNTPSLLAKLPDPTGKISPPRRVLNSSLLSARRTVADLVETPYIFKENKQGVATTQGPALDRLVKMETGKARVGMARQFDNAFARYRFGAAPDSVKERVAQNMTRLMDHTGRPREKASFAEFRAMVDDALRNNDLHDIPEVAETARYLRTTIIAPWRDRAIAAGLLPEGVDVTTADSYMTRVWNKEKLIGERPKAIQVFSDWLQGQEEIKAGLQEKLRGLKAELDTVSEKIAKLESAKVKIPGNEGNLIDANIARDKLLAQIEDAVLAWDGKSSKAAKSAVKARPEPKGDKRLTAADGDVSAAVARILAKERRVDRKEVEELAQEIISRIVGGPDGRLPYDAPTARNGGFSDANPDARGALSARSFMIPDALVREFIDTDALHTAQIYLQTMAPDVLLTERFGDIRMTEALKKIENEAAAASAAAKTPKERAAINKERENAIADIAAMRDRIRHVYGYSSDPRQQFMGRMAATAARYDIMTNLGGATLTSMADLAGVQWRHGFTSTFKNAWVPFGKALFSKEARAALAAEREQLQTLGIAAETYLNSRSSGLYDVLDVYRPQSKFERGMQLGAEKFGLANLLTPWTDFGKTAAGMVSGAEILKAVKAVSAGKAKPRQIRDLAEGGIDAAMAQRVHAAATARNGADEVSGTRLPNSGLWADEGARNAFEGALARDVDMMIITPGAEKPLMMSRPVAALILQYKSFVVAANERLLVRSLQAQDRQVLQGMVSAIALGMLAEYAYGIAAGRDNPKTVADMVKAGVSRSGMLGWYGEANAITSKWTGGTADAFRLTGTSRPDSRYISRSKLGALLGPTSAKLEALINVGSDMANLTWSAADTQRVRRFMIGQNVFYIRRLLDGLEDDVNRSVGIEPLERGQR